MYKGYHFTASEINQNEVYFIDKAFIRFVEHKKHAKKYGYKVFIEPVFTIKYLNPDISAHEFDVVISTSKNSVKAFSQICKEDNFSIITVGNSTMQAAKNLGFSDIISADSNVDGLISFIKSHYSNAIKFLYIRGQEVSCDLKKDYLKKVLT